MQINHINLIHEYVSKNISFIFLTRLEDGFQEFILVSKPKSISLNVYKKAIAIKESGVSSTTIIDRKEWFVKIYKPFIHLIIIGAVHIAEPLVKLAKIVSINTTIIDPRTNLNIDEKFSNVKISNDWPDVALKKININNNTALVTLTHDPKLDDVALKYILNTDAFYIGCLGSKKTHNDRLLRLSKSGIQTELINKIHGPIGLQIKANSPSEIAVSIISQIILESKNEI